jgi:hypothetical protein
MARVKSDQVFEAILFMQEHHVIKQMRYNEFEAILDGVVGLRELADTEATLVYVEIDRRLNIQALVFFLVYFDEAGQADSDWNLPLRQLAKTSGSGPNMGGGPIHLCCRSQCPIAWQQKDMWDPSMKPGANDFLAIKRALEENRLGFEREVAEVEPVPVSAKAAPAKAAPVAVAPVKAPAAKLGPVKHESIAEDFDFDTDEIPILSAHQSNDAGHDLSSLDAEHRGKVARTLRTQRLRIKTLIGQHQAELEELNRQRRIEIQALKNDVQALSQRSEQLKVLNEQLKIKLDQRNDQHTVLQDQLAEAKKRLVMLDERLRKANLNAAAPEVHRSGERLEAELVILREQLDRRDVELFHRGEREEQLMADIETLKERLEAGSGQQRILDRLADLDVVFVVYHPGAGHITIPSREVERYVENPIAYAAGKCFVSENHYRAWLEHHESPICLHGLPSGDFCADVVQRVTVPNEFVAGRDDRCGKHKR